MPKVSSSTVKEVRNAQDRLKRFLGKLDSVPIEILTEESTRMQAEMKLETPLGPNPESHPLRDSVKCTVTKRGETITLKASASAKSPEGYDYAFVQHDTSFYYHPRGGKYHFVQDPLKDGVLRIKNRLKKEVKF